MSIARIVSVGTAGAPRRGDITFGGFDTPQGGRLIVTQSAPVEFPVGFPPGQPGQVIGYDAESNPIAIDPTAAGFPPGLPGQMFVYDEQGVAGPIDPFIPLETVDW